MLKFNSQANIWPNTWKKGSVCLLFASMVAFIFALFDILISN